LLFLFQETVCSRGELYCPSVHQPHRYCTLHCNDYTATLYISRTGTVPYNISILPIHTAPLYISSADILYLTIFMNILPICTSAAQVLYLTILLYCLYCPFVHKPHRYCTWQHYCTAYIDPLYISRIGTIPYNITVLNILPICTSVLLYCLYCPFVHRPHRYCTLQYYCTDYTAPLYISRTGTVPYNITVLIILPLCTSAAQVLYLKIKINILPICTSAAQVLYLIILLYWLYCTSVHQPHRYCTL
jgi:hypothetical protein